MIRKLSLNHLDKVIEGFKNGLLKKVKIYKSNSKSSKGNHMINYKLSDTIPTHLDLSNHNDAQFLMSIKAVRNHVLRNDFETMSLEYEPSNGEPVKLQVVEKSKK